MTTTQCRRCSVCVGQSHHWLDNPDCMRYDSETGLALNDDGEVVNVFATHVCKHCPALGDECPACQGAGLIEHGTGQPNSEGGELTVDITCPDCNGEGVRLYDPDPFGDDAGDGST